MSRTGKRHSRLKSLIAITDDENELIELVKDAESLNAQAENARLYRSAELRLIRDKLKSVRERREDISVTDHALVRYLERVKGVDVDTVRKEMADHIPESLEHGGGVEFIEYGELVYVVRDRLIITIRPKL